ncbi:MAG: magnesium and cobalt transport protein CorA [Acidimicrobiales bacterium]
MIIDVAAYRDGKRCDDVVTLDQALRVSHHGEGFVWLGLYEPTQDEFDVACRRFDLHELAVEDAIKAHQRPKLEVYGPTVSMVLKTARYLDAEEEVEFGEIFLFVGDDFVVAVRHGEASALGDVRRELEGRPDRLTCGPSAVLHAIVDRVVDDYLPVLEGIDTDIEEVEEQVFSRAGENPVERIYNLKREVLDFHRATVPLVDPVERLAEGKVPNVHGTIQPYFRDVHDHLVRVTERVVADRDLLNSVLEANLTQVGIRQNEDMRKISAWVAIGVVPTLLAGIYGMNLRHMPLLEHDAAFPIVVGVMVGIAVGLFALFRRRDWL